MKHARTTAALTAATLAASGILLVGSPASAATTIDDVTFYNESDFGVESGGYPMGYDWFWGDVSGTEGPHAFTVGGLELNADLSGDVQLLNQNVTTPATADDMIDVLETVAVFSTGADWNFQLPFFAEGETGFTTLRPSVLGGVQDGGWADVYTLDLSSPWITSSVIYEPDGVTEAFAAGASAPLADLLAALYDGLDPVLLAYGFFIDDSVSATIQALWWDGAASAFTPVVTRTFPSSISITDASTTGIPVSLAGALPGVAVYLHLDYPDGTVAYEDYTTPFSADGTFATNIVLPADAPQGTYLLTLDDDDYVYGFLGILPTEQPIEVTAAVLPATGADAGLAGIAVLVLLGGVVVVLASRRMRTA